MLSLSLWTGMTIENVGVSLFTTVTPALADSQVIRATRRRPKTLSEMIG